ncbi:hypothetical protein M9Y10_007790 [Tritrichomonas musculus]|uniref:Calcineurin-like phosphoesterase domain-containing protein n=1 Tax=Tritrichomonas musculus TaxID=1915356 RepID=A0ABR2J3F6_9EUKA
MLLKQGKYQNPLPFDLKTNTATFYDVPNKLKSNFIGLIISDQHFGRYNEMSSSLNAFKTKLEEKLKETHATCLFMLGDTFDYYLDNYKESVVSVFQYLETLTIPVFLLGGNHDKERLLKINYNFNKNLKFVKETFIHLQHPNPNGENFTGILMGHDLGNDFQVDPDDAPIYVKWMKDVFDRYFSPGEMMLLGHTHQNIFLNECNAYSIKQFSPEFDSFAYAIIKDEGNRYDVCFLEC